MGGLQSCRMFNNFNGCYAIVHGLIHNNLNLSTALWEVFIFFFRIFVARR
jgi:hypothetical protein